MPKSIEILTTIVACLLSFQAIAMSPDVEYRSFATEVNSLLIKGEFNSLEILADKIRTDNARFKDGRWKLTAFYEGMHPISNRTPNSKWQSHEALIKKWLNQNSNSSPTPYVALASFYTARAWRDRGEGTASTVTDEGWKGWSKNLTLAKGVLNDSASISKQCPHWFNVMQNVALGEGWDETQYEELFQEAVSKEPAYYFYYFSKANFYQTRWHGSKEKLMEFVNDSVKSTYDVEGYTLYARIYWSAEREFGRLMFQPGNVDWSKMKAGFEFINTKYPESKWNQNAFAHFACRAGDKEATAQALKKVSADINLGAWWSYKEYEYCKDWALGSST